VGGDKGRHLAEAAMRDKKIALDWNGWKREALEDSVTRAKARVRLIWIGLVALVVCSL
jgi:hypothetical protein